MNGLKRKIRHTVDGMLPATTRKGIRNYLLFLAFSLLLAALPPVFRWLASG